MTWIVGQEFTVAWFEVSVYLFETMEELHAFGDVEHDNPDLFSSLTLSKIFQKGQYSIRIEVSNFVVHGQVVR